MTLKGGTSQACAACKYQRRKCTSECPLAPYFPADKPKMFQNAHKLFGVRNILNILKQIDPNQHGEAMNSIIFQSTMRDLYPVSGCCGIINGLVNQIRLVQEEWNSIHATLSVYRQQHQQQNGQHLHNNDPTSELDLGVATSQLDLGMAPPDSSISLLHHDGTQPQFFNEATNSLLPVPMQQHCPLAANNSTDYTINDPSYIDLKDNSMQSVWNQRQFSSNSNINNMISIQSQLVPLQMVDGQEPEDYDPNFDIIDRHSCMTLKPKEPYESSPESSIKDTKHTIERVGENELKSAAASFSLTSVKL